MNLDILIKNGKIVDGTGNLGFYADLGVKAGKIVFLGKSKEKLEAKKIIDANNRVLCPGFIDIHSHADYYIPFDPLTQSTLQQGITTLVVGMCGSSLAPVNPEKKELFEKEFEMSAPPGLEYNVTWSTFDEYLTEMEKIGCSSNTANFVGFGPIRLCVMSYDNRAPTEAELEQMKGLVDEAMAAGAFGMSTGLIYTPQVYAETDEIIEVAKVIGKHQGLYFSHVRGEGATVVDAVKEAIEIVEKSGCVGGQIAHHKVSGKKNWGKSVETLKLIEEANKRGVNVTCDQYPYNRGMTSLVTLLPPWVHEGGMDKLLERLQDPEEKKKIKQEMLEGNTFESFVESSGWDKVYIASLETEKWKAYEGKSLAEIAELLERDDEFEVLCDILIDEQAKGSMTIESMGEEDIKRIMQSKYTMVGTDSSAVAPTGSLSSGKPHPRYYGTCPRILGKYVRKEQILEFEEAIRKMTSFPAQRLGLFDRGLIREGNWADIVIFDPKTIIDKATFLEPHQYPEGIEYIIVNGEITIEKGKHLGIKAGKVLRKK
ncbi:MAG: amidohydrolase family protein [Candidatus Heimdallarchaeota archaeon]|nr:amidohydrolase family protein [Candidatus Heimdallarchaeota archaeon]